VVAINDYQYVEQGLVLPVPVALPAPTMQPQRAPQQPVFKDRRQRFFRGSVGGIPGASGGLLPIVLAPATIPGLSYYHWRDDDD